MPSEALTSMFPAPAFPLLTCPKSLSQLPCGQRVLGHPAGTLGLAGRNALRAEGRVPPAHQASRLLPGRPSERHGLSPKPAQAPGCASQEISGVAPDPGGPGSGQVC